MYSIEDARAQRRPTAVLAAAYLCAPPAAIGLVGALIALAAGAPIAAPMFIALGVPSFASTLGLSVIGWRTRAAQWCTVAVGALIALAGAALTNAGPTSKPVFLVVGVAWGAAVALLVLAPRRSREWFAGSYGP